MIEEKLQQDSILLQKQLDWLRLSYAECKTITPQKRYSIEEFGKFEILCSRYSRSIDFLIRKIFRTIDAYEFEDQGTLIDTVNHAHKRGLVDNIEELRIMKDIRNTIVHEYVEEALKEVFAEVIEYTQKLIEIMQRTIDYIETTHQP